MKWLRENAFTAPLFQTSKRNAILWISITILLILKIYEGDHKFFTEHFQHLNDGSEWFLWYKWLWHHGASLLLFFLIPVLTIKLVLKEKLVDFGLKIGNYKVGLKATLITFIIMPFIVYNSAQNPEHHEFYSTHFPLDLATQSGWMFILWAVSYLPHYIGWEFFFRGFVQFGFKEKMGLFGAIMFQTLLTALMHIGKPEGETWGAVAGGIYMGLLTFRTGSIYYALIFHFYLGLLNTYFCSL